MVLRGCCLVDKEEKMSFKKFGVLVGFIILMAVTAFIVFAEEPAAAPTDSASATTPVGQPAAPKSENETQWAWGEVINLDAPAKTLTLKHLDYETDQERDLVLTVDEKTVFENIKSLDEIKIKDTLIVDYLAGVNGRNIAKNINFEKPDSLPAASAQAAENTTPVDLTPVPIAAPPQPTAQQPTEAASGSSAPAPAEAASATGQAQ